MLTNHNLGKKACAILTISQDNNGYIFTLEGLTDSPILARGINNLDEYTSLLQRWADVKLDDTDLKELNFPKDLGNIYTQNIKILFESGGSFIYTRLFPESISSVLKNSDVQYLCLNIDDTLAGIPWELMYDGKEFFCMKYSIGRVITHEMQISRQKRTDNNLKFLLITDPTGSLSASKKEVSYLSGRLMGLPKIKLQRKGFQLHKKEFLKILSAGGCDILHFSGHGEFNGEHPDKSYLQFYDIENPCYAHEISDSLSDNPPKLVFNNACNSAQSIVGMQGIVSAFISRGTSSYIGTILPVCDDVAGMMAEEFYRYIVIGKKSIGDALRLARINTYKKFGWNIHDWTYFVLYGNPAIKLLK